ncbi:hypothetical protein [Tateyamaria sp. syn59]|uniref:hypothetical protein n=1 Tax=Tateyamaria sp. syn59 TaxID=2576942 RepID=UPI0011BF0A9E|nr:hypothetical protein [Tateyamaria sp. syn59]
MPLSLSTAKSMILALAIALGCVASGDAQPLFPSPLAKGSEDVHSGALESIPASFEAVRK